MADSFVEFDPNAPDKDTRIWATYIPWRSPAFKTHSKRAHALSAISPHRRAKLYEFRQGRWELVATKDDTQMPNQCDICGWQTTTTQIRQARFLSHHQLCQVFDRDRAGRLIEPLHVLAACYQCRDARGL